VTREPFYANLFRNAFDKPLLTDREIVYHGVEPDEVLHLYIVFWPEG
jgi:hypothetical protein